MKDIKSKIVLQNIERNRVIAGFDINAMPVTPVMGEKLPFDMWRYKGENRPYGYADLRYDCDWNWLMAVVRQIIDICIENEKGEFESDYYTSILETVPLAVIEDTHKVVFEFIQWWENLK